MRIALIFLSFITLFLSSALLWVGNQWLNVPDPLTEDRERTINNYQKVIAAMARTRDINPEHLRQELAKDFEVSEKAGYYDNDQRYYYVLFPRDPTIDRRPMWQSYGLELHLDKQLGFQGVSLHKP